MNRPYVTRIIDSDDVGLLVSHLERKGLFLVNRRVSTTTLVATRYGRRRYYYGKIIDSDGVSLWCAIMNGKIYF